MDREGHRPQRLGWCCGNAWSNRRSAGLQGVNDLPVRMSKQSAGWVYGFKDRAVIKSTETCRGDVTTTSGDVLCFTQSFIIQSKNTNLEAL